MVSLDPVQSGSIWILWPVRTQQNQLDLDQIVQCGQAFSDQELSNGQLYTAPRRGGNRGDLTTISVHPGEKVIGMFGSTGVSSGATIVSRLYILKQTTSGSVQIYGPYGNRASANTFVVFGDIKSIFGRSGSQLDAIGFYYEPWGAC